MEHDPHDAPHASHDDRPGLHLPAAPPDLPGYEVGDDVGTLHLNTPVVIAELEALGYTVRPPVDLPDWTPPDIDPPDPPDPGDVTSPEPTTRGLSIQSGADVDFEWAESYASWWCDHESNFIYRNLVIDGRLIRPNPNQVEPKNFGADDFVFDGLVVRNISSCRNGDAGNNSGDDVHTEGLYLGASNRGEIRNSYWGFTDGNTAVAIFGTWFPDDGDDCDELLLHNIRLDVGGVNGDGRTYWGGPIYYTFQGKVRNCIVRNAQIRRGAAGGDGHFGNAPQAWPHGPAWGGSGYWEYDGSRTGGNSGQGFEWVEQGQPWPDFPDGDETLPKSLCNRGY